MGLVIEKQKAKEDEKHRHENEKKERKETAQRKKKYELEQQERIRKLRKREREERKRKYPDRIGRNGREEMGKGGKQRSPKITKEGRGMKEEAMKGERERRTQEGKSTDGVTKDGQERGLGPERREKQTNDNIKSDKLHRRKGSLREREAERKRNSVRQKDIEARRVLFPTNRSRRTNSRGEYDNTINNSNFSNINGRGDDGTTTNNSNHNHTNTSTAPTTATTTIIITTISSTSNVNSTSAASITTNTATATTTTSNSSNVTSTALTTPPPPPPPTTTTTINNSINNNNENNSTVNNSTNNSLPRNNNSNENNNNGTTTATTISINNNNNTDAGNTILTQTNDSHTPRSNTLYDDTPTGTTTTTTTCTNNHNNNTQNNDSSSISLPPHENPSLETILTQPQLLHSPSPPALTNEPSNNGDCYGGRGGDGDCHGSGYCEGDSGSFGDRGKLGAGRIVDNGRKAVDDGSYDDDDDDATGGGGGDNVACAGGRSGGVNGGGNNIPVTRDKNNINSNNSPSFQDNHTTKKPEDHVKSGHDTIGRRRCEADTPCADKRVSGEGEICGNDKDKGNDGGADDDGARNGGVKDIGDDRRYQRNDDSVDLGDSGDRGWVTDEVMTVGDEHNQETDSGAIRGDVDVTGEVMRNDDRSSGGADEVNDDDGGVVASGDDGGTNEEEVPKNDFTPVNERDFRNRKVLGNSKSPENSKLSVNEMAPKNDNTPENDRVPQIKNVSQNENVLENEIATRNKHSYRKEEGKENGMKEKEEDIQEEEKKENIQEKEKEEERPQEKETAQNNEEKYKTKTKKEREDRTKRKLEKEIRKKNHLEIEIQKRGENQTGSSVKEEEWKTTNMAASEKGARARKEKKRSGKEEDSIGQLRLKYQQDLIKAIQSLDTLNDQIVEFVFSGGGAVVEEQHGGSPKQREVLKSSMALMRRLLLDAQSKFRKMVEDNKHLASRIDGDLQTANQEVSLLRQELADTNRRITQLQVVNHHSQDEEDQHGEQQETQQEEHQEPSPGSTTISSTTNMTTTTNALNGSNKYHSESSSNPLVEELSQLRMENEKLCARNQCMQSEVQKLRRVKETMVEEDLNLKPKLNEMTMELTHAKEALSALKADRKRLKAEKFDLINQMKQLYATLEDKEKELRDFIRNYEQRMKESDESLRHLATERDETEREKWNILKHARDESERVVKLSAHLGLKETALKKLQEEFEMLRKQLASVGYYSDAESVKTNGLPTPTASTPTCSPLPVATPTPTPNGRGSSADSGVRLSSDRDSTASHDGGPGTPKESPSLSPLYATPMCVRGGEDQMPTSTNQPHPHPNNNSTPLSGLANSSACSGGLSRSAEHLCEHLSEAVEPNKAEGRGTTTLTRKNHKAGGGTWGSISRVFARQKKRAALDTSIYDGSGSDKRASWSPSSSLCVSPLTEESYSGKLRLLEEAQHVPLERWKAPTVLAWLEVTLGMPQYGAMCAENVRSGKVLLELSDSELETGLDISHPMHRKKLRLAIEELREPRLTRFPRISVLGHTWVSSEWLPDLGLPQYSESFANSLVDGRLLEALTKKELEKHLGVHRKFHQASIIHGVHLLRIVRFDRLVLAERRRQSEMVDSDPVVWTNMRWVRWARSIDLAEYADNLKDSGVHGALVVLESSFTSDTMATALGIPQSKNIIRRHLATELEGLVLPARQQLDEQARYAKMERRRQEKLASGGSLGRSFSRSYGTGLEKGDKERRRASLRIRRIVFYSPCSNLHSGQKWEI